jgi:hypothetical protein
MDTNKVDIFIYQIDNDIKEIMTIPKTLTETIKNNKFEVYCEEQDEFSWEITCKELSQKQITNVIQILRRTQKRFNKINDCVCIGINIRF